MNKIGNRKLRLPKSPNQLPEGIGAGVTSVDCEKWEDSLPSENIAANFMGFRVGARSSPLSLLCSLSPHSHSVYIYFGERVFLPHCDDILMSFYFDL